MKINFNAEQKHYIRSLLFVVVAQTPTLKRSQRRQLLKIASKVEPHSTIPNFKPAERIALFHILAMGPKILEVQQKSAADAGDEAKVQLIEQKKVMLGEILEKLEVIGEASPVDARPTEYASGG